MLTEEESRFVEYWEQRRQSKKKFLWKLAAGLPLGALVAAAIFINYFSSWYSRAAMEVRVSSSGVLVVLIGLLLVVAFIVIFSAYHRWDMNEQRYKELIAKKDIQ